MKLKLSKIKTLVCLGYFIFTDLGLSWYTNNLILSVLFGTGAAVAMYLSFLIDMYLETNTFYTKKVGVFAKKKLKVLKKKLEGITDKRIFYLGLSVLVICAFLGLAIANYFQDYTVNGLENKLRAAGLNVVEGWQNFPYRESYNSNNIMPYLTDVLNYYPREFNVTTAYLLPEYADHNPTFIIVYAVDSGTFLTHVWRPGDK